MNRLLASLGLSLALAVVAAREARAESATVPDVVGLGEEAGKALLGQAGFEASVTYLKSGAGGRS